MNDSINDMYQDRKVGTGEYRVILDPVSTCNPEGSKVALFLRQQGKLLKLGDDVVARPGQTDDELIQEAWRTAEYHANNS